MKMKGQRREGGLRCERFENRGSWGAGGKGGSEMGRRRASRGGHSQGSGVGLGRLLQSLAGSPQGRGPQSGERRRLNCFHVPGL